MSHPAESTHYYNRRGLPAYTVKARDGSSRPTTLRDARKLDLVPSVTSIIRCAAAPGLELWKQQQVLLAALTLPKIEGEAEAAYIARITEDSREQARKAAERGTVIHAAIQGFFQHERIDPAYMPYVQGACDALRDWAGDEFDSDCCMVEQSFAHPLGFGGKVDICGTSPMFVADFKTKEFTETGELKAWDEHFMQLAAYRHGLEMTSDGYLAQSAQCAIVYVSTTAPGLCHVIEAKTSELDRGWRMFKSLLEYWHAKTSYDSAFERIAA